MAELKRYCVPMTLENDKKVHKGHFEKVEINDTTCKSFGEGSGCDYWDMEKNKCVYGDEKK